MIPTDLYNELSFEVVEPIASSSDNTPFVSAIVDMQGKMAMLFAIFIGTLADADATFAVLLEHGEDAGLADAEAVPDDQLLGTEALAGFTFADDDTVERLGYRGTKRYLRLTITPAANTGAATLGVLAIFKDQYRGVTG